MTIFDHIQALIGLGVLLVLAFLAMQRAVHPRRTRRSTNSDLLGVFDEVFSPARHTTRLELRTHQDQGPVTPTGVSGWAGGPD